MTEENSPAHLQTPQPVGCIIASTQIIPELVNIRGVVNEAIRENSRQDDRLQRLHLQADDANRRLTRLEGMVETQTKEFQTLARRFDSLDSKVQSLLDSFAGIRSTLDTRLSQVDDKIEGLISAFTSHGIMTTDQHQKRMRGQMTIWVTIGAILIILSSLHYQQTGVTPLESMFKWAMGAMPGASP